MADQFSECQPGLSSPYSHAAAVTPSDEADLATSTRGLYVGASGDVKVTLVGGETVTLVDLAAGVVHPLRVQRVHSSDTDATGIVGLW